MITMFARLIFFFSSRRRHTRYWRDWSSDVCSSDLCSSDVASELQKRLDCMASTKNRRDCPAGLATGSGTGFRFVTEHVADFSKRGICARDPTRALIDQASMKMPRRSQTTDDWDPYTPAGALPDPPR